MIGAATVDWVQILVQGGPWAVVVLLILLGKLVPVGSYERVIQENNELKSRLAHLDDIMEKQVIPAMVRYADGLSRQVER